ncbi:MAG: peptidase T [Calditrichaeota bacterium]|nr:MAG: peptidase T [Calditrichota bacterium]
MNIPRQDLLKRFLRYVKIDTQSSEESQTYPSTEKQLELSRLLISELKEMGITDVQLTPHGYVFATLPSNLPENHPVQVPPIGLIAHVDTSPDVSGANVNPMVHQNYDGKKIVLPGDPSQVIDPEANPALKNCIGHDIITSDGTTLLGADNKAGVAEIMTAIDYLIQHPEIPHGEIKIAFTVDEEIGKGTLHFDVKEFGARYAYTIDGETAGEIEDETFCADTVDLTVHGINVHPGFAKNKMVNALKIAADFLAALPRETLSPETTEGREGYIHPNTINGNVEKVEIRMLIRDFTVDGLKEKEKLLESIREKVLQSWPRGKIDFKVTESYRNMRYILDQYPFVVEYAMEAVRRSGLEPRKSLIRGGTDGARLSYMGLPTPNIFTGGHNFHSKREWASLQDMEKAVETIINLVQIWAERGEGTKEASS